jgi:hypothetical protein
LTFEAGGEILGSATRFPIEPAPDEMKTASKNGKARANGTLFTRKELLAAHERALKRVGKMSDQEGFASLVRAGIYTPDGKLTPRYGG